MSSVGLLPVNISSKNIPRLHTSPIVETAEPSPYSTEFVNIFDRKFHLYHGANYNESTKEFQSPGAKKPIEPLKPVMLFEFC
jgi:hypothetical protein